MVNKKSIILSLSLLLMSSSLSASCFSSGSCSNPEKELSDLLINASTPASCSTYLPELNKAKSYSGLSAESKLKAEQRYNECSKEVEANDLLLSISDINDCSVENTIELKKLSESSLLDSTTKLSLKDKYKTCEYTTTVQSNIDLLTKEIKENPTSDICTMNIESSVAHSYFKNVDLSRVSTSVATDVNGINNMCQDSAKAAAEAEEQKVCSDTEALKDIFLGSNTSLKNNTWKLCDSLSNFGTQEQFISYLKSSEDTTSGNDGLSNIDISITDSVKRGSFESLSKEKANSMKAEFLIALGYRYLPLVLKEDIFSVSLRDKGTTGVFLGDNVDLKPSLKLDSAFTVDSMTEFVDLPGTRLTTSYASKKKAYQDKNNPNQSVASYNSKSKLYGNLTNSFQNFPVNKVIKASSANVTIYNYEKLSNILSNIFNYIPSELEDQVEYIQGGIISSSHLADLYNNYDNNISAQKEFIKITGVKKEDLPTFPIEAEFISGYSDKVPLPGLTRKQYNWVSIFGNHFSSPGKTVNERYIPAGEPSITDIQSTFNYGGSRSSLSDTFWTLQGGIDIQREGYYRFQSCADDGVRLWVDNTMLIRDWTAHGVMCFTGGKYLTKGVKPIELQFFDQGGNFALTLKWDAGLGGGFSHIPSSVLKSNGNNDCASDYFVKAADGSCVFDKSKWDYAMAESLKNKDKRDSSLKKLDFVQGSESVTGGYFYDSSFFNPIQMEYQTGIVKSVLDKSDYSSWSVVEMNERNANTVKGSLFETNISEAYNSCLRNDSVSWTGNDLNENIDIFITQEEGVDYLKSKTKESLLSSFKEEAVAELGKYLNEEGETQMLSEIEEDFTAFNGSAVPDLFQYKARAYNLKENSFDIGQEIYNTSFTKFGKNLIDISVRDIFEDKAKGYEFTTLTVLNPSTEQFLDKTDNPECSYTRDNVLDYYSGDNTKEQDYLNVDKINIRFSQPVTFEDIESKSVFPATIYFSETKDCSTTEEKVISMDELLNYLNPWITVYYEEGDAIYSLKKESEFGTEKALMSFIINAKKFNNNYIIKKLAAVDYNTMLNTNLQGTINNIENVCNNFLNFSSGNDEEIRNRLYSYSNLAADLKKKDFGGINIDSIFSGFKDKTDQRTLNASKKIRFKKFGVEFYWSPSDNFCSNNVVNGKHIIGGNSVKSAVLSFIDRADNVIRANVKKTSSFTDLMKFAEKYGYIQFKKDISIAKYFEDNEMKEAFVEEFLKMHNYKALKSSFSVKLEDRNTTLSVPGLSSVSFGSINMTVPGSCHDEKILLGWKLITNYVVKSTYMGRAEASSIVENLRGNFLSAVTGEIDIDAYNGCINDLQSNNKHTMYIKNMDLKTLNKSSSIQHFVKPTENVYNQVAKPISFKSKGSGNTWNDIYAHSGKLSLTNSTMKADFCNNLFKKEKKVNGALPDSFKKVMGYSSGSLIYNKFYEGHTGRDLYNRKNPLQSKACKSTYNINSTTGELICDKVTANEGDVNRDDVVILIRNVGDKNTHYLAIEALDIKQFILNNETGVSKSLYGSMDLVADLVEVGNYDTKTELDNIEDKCIEFKGQFEYRETMDYETGELTSVKVYPNMGKDFAFKYNDEAYLVDDCSKIKGRVTERRYNANITCEDNIQAANNMLLASNQDKQYTSSINKYMDSELSDFNKGIDSILNQATTSGATKKFENGKTTVSLTNDNSERITSLEFANRDKFVGDTAQMKQYDLNAQFGEQNINTFSSNGSGTLDMEKEYKSLNNNVADVKSRMSGNINRPNSFLGLPTNGNTGSVDYSINEDFKSEMNIESCETCSDKEKIISEAKNSLNSYKSSSNYDSKVDSKLNSNKKRKSLKEIAEESIYEQDYKQDSDKANAAQFKDLYKNNNFENSGSRFNSYR